MTWKQEIRESIKQASEMNLMFKWRSFSFNQIPFKYQVDVARWYTLLPNTSLSSNNVFFYFYCSFSLSPLKTCGWPQQNIKRYTRCRFCSFHRFLTPTIFWTACRINYAIKLFSINNKFFINLIARVHQTITSINEWAYGRI